MKQVPLKAMKDDLSRYVELSAKEDIVITKHGVPAAILVGLGDPDALWEEALSRNPRLKERIAKAQASAKAGRVKTLELAKPKKPAQRQTTMGGPGKSPQKSTRTRTKTSRVA